LGAVSPIKFHCENNKRNTIMRAQNGIGLVISEQGINGENVNYEFKYSTGHLN
jgi:hypothetical protein